MTKQSGSPRPERLLKPSNDSQRIAGALRSSAGRAPAAPAAEPAAPLLARAVEDVIQARALRSAHVPAELLGESAWDMLLELLHAELSGRRVTPAILGKAAGVLPATGQRWIDALVAKGLCTRSADDPAEVAIRLSTDGSRAMHAYFAAFAEQWAAGGR